MQGAWIALQFVVSVVAGSAAYWWDCRQVAIGQGSLLWGVIVGIVAARAVTFLVVWCRFGWCAARSLSLSG